MRGRREEKEASQVFFPEGGGWGDPPESFIHCTAFSCENMITNFLPSFSHVNSETKTEHSVTKVCTMAFLAGHPYPDLGLFCLASQAGCSLFTFGTGPQWTCENVKELKIFIFF
jgi:hypothetical protein